MSARRKHALTIPARAPDDPLGQLADSYGRLTDTVVRLYAKLNGMPEGAASEAFERERITPAEAELSRAERALMHAMDELKTPFLVAGGKLFVSTCFGPDIPDLQTYVLTFDLADLNRPAPLRPEGGGS